MRKRLLKLTAAALIVGAPTVALAMPASAATLSATSLTAAVSSFSVATFARLAETSTGTSTGTGTALFNVMTLGVPYLVAVTG